MAEHLISFEGAAIVLASKVIHCRVTRKGLGD